MPTEVWAIIKHWCSSSRPARHLLVSTVETSVLKEVVGKGQKVLDCDPDYNTLSVFFSWDATMYILIPSLLNKHLLIDSCFSEI